MLKKLCILFFVAMLLSSDCSLKLANGSVRGKTYFWPALIPESIPYSISFYSDGTMETSNGFQSTWREGDLRFNNAFWYTDPVKTVSPNGFELYQFGFGYQFGNVLHGYFPGILVSPFGPMSATIEIIPIAIESPFPADVTE